MTTSDDQIRKLRADLDRVVPMPDEAWAAAAPLFSRRTLAAGEHAVEAGQAVSELLLLTSGLARYYYLDPQGKEFNKSFSARGQALSSVFSLVTGQASPFYVQAMTPCECLAIAYGDLLDLADRFPAWNALRVRLLEELVIKKERREADFLLLSAAERYEKFTSDFAHVAHLIPNYHIASYLGITEVALSRIRRRMGLTRVNARFGR